ncbi:hypothetical protein R50072_29360 [Simiduia litorea]|uniref:putative adhesin n=1 Tax=Simiduia litorea TaxID=1435348 RepID=UPI0036F2BC99
MSIILTDSQGRRYRLTHGWGSDICSNKNLFRGPGQAQAFIGELAPQQTTEIYQTFFGSTDYLPRHLCTPQANAGAISGPSIVNQVSTNNDRIADAIERSQLIIEKDTSLQPVADDRAILRVKIRQALNEILSDERQEAARHQALMDQESALGKSLIYTGAAMTGLGKAAWGLLCWAKEASDLVNPVVRLQNRIKALAVASQADNKLEVFATQLQKEEWREVVEVIGFDPTQITREQMAQAMDATSLIMDDATLASDLKTFSWNYIKAQHAIELTEAGGAAVFEIILTAVLAALTGGAGAIAATASKARHMTKFKKLGQLLVDFAKASKELAEHAKEQAKRAAKSVKRSFDDVKTGDSISAGATNTPKRPNRVPTESDPKTKESKTSSGDKEIFSGHGDYSATDGVVVVPEGTKITFYSEHGATITDDLGNAIEQNQDLSKVYKKTYEAGDAIPNYALYPGDDLNITGNPTTVKDRTLLKDLLKPDQGDCHWAACTYDASADASNRVYDIDGIIDEDLESFITIYD